MHKILSVSQCPSTNDEILHHLGELKKEDTQTLYTFDQTKGRGQYGNVWEVVPCQNLAFSIAFLSERISMSHHLFNFHTVNILRRFIAKKTEKQTKVKWPNDIILLGKKVSGMLIERKKIAKKEFFIVGIGINILQEKFENLPKAGSIFSQTGVSFDLEKWTKEMHCFFVESFFEYSTNIQVLDEFNQNLFRKDQISVFEIQGLRQNGIIRSVDEQGFLWVELENGELKKFYHKEMELLY